MTLREAKVISLKEQGVPAWLIPQALRMADVLAPTGETEAVIPLGREREVIELLKQRKAQEAYDIAVPPSGLN